MKIPTEDDISDEEAVINYLKTNSEIKTKNQKKRIKKKQKKTLQFSSNIPTYICDEVITTDPVRIEIRKSIVDMNKSINVNTPHCRICGDIKDLVNINYTNGNKVIMCSDCVVIQHNME